MALASVEFSHGLRAGGFRPAVPLALLASATLPLAARDYGLQAMLAFTVLVVVFSLLWFLWEITPGRPLAGVASTVLAFGYVGLLGGYAGLLLGATHGIGLLLGAVICTVSYDVVGFFVGSQFGKTPIAPRISPNKTVEGTLAGMVASAVLGLLVVGQIYPWNGSKGLVLGVLVAVGAFLGDLCESMLKRDLGVKDFGTLLPGHGGVLDRFDSMLFALPITFYLAIHLNIL
jgi:phosphatidate cytidylyltransferase